MARVYISIGSNHDCERNISLALARLGEMFGSLERSPVYRSAAVGGHAADYQNLAVGFDTPLSLAEVYRAMQGIEAALGRDRSSTDTVSIDLDILLYGEVLAHRLPHPDIFRYLHVLKPLADIAGDRVPPGGRMSLDDMLRDMSSVNDELEVVREY